MVDYNPPKTVKTTTEKATPAVTKSVAEPNWKLNQATVVTVSQMIDAQKNAVSDTAIEAIDRYLGILEGTIGVDADKLPAEQLSFMKTISNTLDLSYENYVLATDFLVLRLRDNANVLTDDNVFRLIYRIPAGAYKKTEVERYKRYMTALLTLSRNLTTRNRIAKMIDIASLVKGYKPLVAQNITMYFQRNYS